MKEPTVSVSEPCGIVVVDKPAGVTSHDVVNIMRRTYGTRRVGHAGTLDPMATGVLIVLVGRAVKVSEHIMSGKKRYSATLRLGVETDTEDITGTVVAEYKEKLPSFDEVQDACRAFLGEYMQTPPMYRALKRGGQKLVDLRAAALKLNAPRALFTFTLLVRNAQKGRTSIKSMFFAPPVHMCAHFARISAAVSAAVAA